MCRRWRLAARSGGRDSPEEFLSRPHGRSNNLRVTARLGSAPGTRRRLTRRLRFRGTSFVLSRVVQQPVTSRVMREKEIKAREAAETHDDVRGVRLPTRFRVGRHNLRRITRNVVTCSCVASLLATRY